MKLSSDPSRDANSNLASEGSTKNEAKNFYAVKNIVGHENQPRRTQYIVRCYGYGPQDAESAAQIPQHFRDVYWRGLRSIHIRSKATKYAREPSVKRHASGRTATKMNSSRNPAPTFLCRSSTLRCQLRPPTYTKKSIFPNTNGTTTIKGTKLKATLTATQYLTTPIRPVTND